MTLSAYRNTCLISGAATGAIVALTTGTALGKVLLKKDKTEEIAQRAAYLALEQVCSDIDDNEEDDSEE